MLGSEALEETLADLAPSAKFVYRSLEYNGQMTQKELAAETRLSPRTVRYAVSRLEEAGLVDASPALHDARQTCYSLARAAGVESDVLVDADWVAESLESFRGAEADRRLVAVGLDDSRAAYIPGTVELSGEGDPLDPNRRGIPDREELEALLGEAGLTADTSVVLYDGGDAHYAAYAYWVLAYYGHTDSYLLDGGLDAWLEAGRETVAEPASYGTADYESVGTLEHVRAYRDDVSRALAQDEVLIDARSPEEHEGSDAGDGEMAVDTRAEGHIPGAINIPWESLLDGDGFRSRSDLQELFRDRGVPNDERIIVYCSVGARSALTWFALSELCGYPEVLNYDGSWTEWGNLVDVPVE